MLIHELAFIQEHILILVTGEKVSFTIFLQISSMGIKSMPPLTKR